MTLLMPRTLDEALTMLAGSPGAVPAAGGTDLLVRWPAREAGVGKPLLDLSGLDELRYHDLDADALVLGARATYWDVLSDERVSRAFPLLAAAARQVGAVQIQARGTWAGNIVNASPAADGVMALMAYDAVVELRSAAGREAIPLADFYLGYRQTRRRPDQLVTAIRVPRVPRDQERFEKVGSRAAQTISKVGLATCRAAGEWRVVVNSMAPTVRRCPSLEMALATRGRTTLAEWLPLIRGDLAPIDDLRSTRVYREEALARMLHAFDLGGGA
ncbi:MAG: molybdopterin dehydrogenase FAD-binding protein [Gemmatimonadetes bacterium]|nr:molybdopterin dehydrogenase FAD-binding protein [Gemmatimonadota bacterium]